MGKDQDFLEAARNGNIIFIEKILNQKAKRSGPLASLRRGPGINVQDNGGYSALHYSALNGHTDIVRLLLVNEASPNILDSRGSSPLHLAAWAGHQDIVKMLLTHPYKPANPDMQTIENETPLHCAAQHGHTGALTTLLAHGANPNVCNSRNETPLDLAAQYGRLQVVQMLIRAHPELLQPYSVQSCISPMSSTYHHTFVSHSALHLASRNGHNNIVEILLSAGVNVNLLTPSGTALHEAALCGKDIVVRTLLEAGADLNAIDSEGRTVLDILREFPPHVTKGIISVINSFRTRYDGDIDERYSFDKSDDKSNKLINTFQGRYDGDIDERLSFDKSDEKSSELNSESTDGCSKDTPSRYRTKINNDSDIVGVSPSISVNSFEQSMTSRDQASSEDLQDFYIPMAPIKLERSAPKKPPRRNLSILPTHLQHLFPSNDLVSTVIEYADNETENLASHSQNQDGYEYTCTARTGLAMSSSKENLNSFNKITNGTNKTWCMEMARLTDTKPVPAPRKLKNTSLSYDASILKSYNPNRKLKRNRENYFAKGQFSLTVSIDNRTTPRKDEHASTVNHIQRPLSQEYPCTPDYLQQSINADSTNSSQGNKLCLSLRNSSGSISSGASLSDRSVSTDCVEEFVGDDPFAGLFKGSTINLNNENHYYRPSTAVEYHRSGEHPPRSSYNENKITCTSVSSVEAFNSGATNIKQKKDENISIPSSDSSGGYDQLSTESSFEHAAPRKSVTNKILSSYNEQEAWQKLSEIMETFGNSNGLNSYLDSDETEQSEDHRKLAMQLEKNGLRHFERTLYLNGYDSFKFINGIFDESDLSQLNITGMDGNKLIKFIKTLPYAKFTPLAIDSNLDHWLKSIQLLEYSDKFKKHLYNTLKSVCGVWEIELQTILEINKIGHRKRILHSVANIRQTIEVNKSSENVSKTKCEHSAHTSKGHLRSNNKNRPAPRPPVSSSLEIRAPTELLIGLPSNLHIKWPHSANALISNVLKYDVYYLGSTLVKELRGTESTRKSIQKLKRVGRSSAQENRPLVQLSISHRGVEFIDIETNGTVCEHEIRNINCACQDADDMTHFAYITKDNELSTHYCHVFKVDNMHLAMEIILTLAESFEVAYQMALKNISLSVRQTKDSTKKN